MCTKNKYHTVTNMTAGVETSEANVTELMVEIIIGLQGYPVSNVAYPDPGSGAFLTPGSGIGFFRIPDPKLKMAQIFYAFS
jgi:hypothetical protein